MRAFDRDPIRGGHYGQRSCEPRLKAEHMAAPTKPCDVKILRANSEPSTHGCTDQALRREDSPCQLGAVHTWHVPDLASLVQDFRTWGVSGRALLSTE